MIGLVLLWLALSAIGAYVLQRHLEQLDARRRASDGDFTIDRVDGLGEFTVAIYRDAGHQCPTCFQTCTHVLQYASRSNSSRWYFCGHCAPIELTKPPIQADGPSW